MAVVLYPDTDEVVAHLPGVVTAVSREADRRAATARVRLAAHRRTGAAKIVVDRGATDSVISLEDEAALAIEFGHADAGTGRPVEGLHIMSGISA